MLQFTCWPSVTELYFNCQNHPQNISVFPEDKALIAAIYPTLQVPHPSSTALAHWQIQNPEWCRWDKIVHPSKSVRGNPVEEQVESYNFSVWKPLNAPMPKSNGAARQPSCNPEVVGITSEMGARNNDRPANHVHAWGAVLQVWGWQTLSASSPQLQPCHQAVLRKNQTWLDQNAKGWKTRERDETAVVITVVSWLLAQGRTVVWSKALLQSQKWSTVSHVTGSNTTLNFQDNLVYIVGKCPSN